MVVWTNLGVLYPLDPQLSKRRHSWLQIQEITDVQVNFIEKEKKKEKMRFDKNHIQVFRFFLN